MSNFLQAELEMMLDEVRFYRKQLGAQEDALRKIKDRERDFLGAMGKINYTKEGLEELVRKAEVETDADMFVTSLKVIHLNSFHFLEIPNYSDFTDNNRISFL